MNLGMYRVWRSLRDRVQLLAQTYDSITVQYSEKEDEDEIIQEILKLIRVELVAPNGRRYVVPGEAKVGWNWGARVGADDIAKAVAEGKRPPRRNEEGLVKWKAGRKDGRERALGLRRNFA